MFHHKYMDLPTPKFTQKLHTSNGLFKNFNFKKGVSFLLFFAAALIIWQIIASPLVVTVNGVGEVSVPANNAIISFTITTNADNPDVSINVCKSKFQLIKNMLLEKGIAEEDISESQITSYPANLVIAGTTGYQSSIQVSFKTIHVSNVSRLIASLYSAGATLVNQPILTVENQDELENQAVKDAFKDAKKQASKIGLRNFKFIRKAIALTEQSSSTTSTSTTKADVETQQENQEASLNGVFKIVKVVTISYKMW